MAQDSNQIQSFKTWVQDPKRVHALRVREGVESGIRTYFNALGYREVRTPLLVSSPGMEPHVRPFEVRPWGITKTDKPTFLPTSPEFAMKKLLAGGMQKIFQISPCFRCEPNSYTHHPEFTMLEFYETETNHFGLMRRVEGLFSSLAQRVRGSHKIYYQGQEISFEEPWPIIEIPTFFLEKTGVDLASPQAREKLFEYASKKKYSARSTDSFDDLYFSVWLNELEAQLPKDRPCFVTKYPASQSALSKTVKDSSGQTWAARFEVYCGGLELGNGFYELTDANALRQKHESEMAVRVRHYGSDLPAQPFDEELFHAHVEGLPECSGIAFGVDRMILLFANEVDIEKTFWLPAQS